MVSQNEFQFDGLKHVYHGKVRDVYTLNNNRLVMVVSDRISAFDHILPRPIPYKGQVLNQLAAYFLEAVRDILPNWLQKVPHPYASIGVKCEPIRVEMVIRGYLVGHAARTYSAGERMLCGIPLPEGLKINQAFETPIITPTTKAIEGHDEDISREEILSRGIVSEAIYTQMEDYTRQLFARGQAMAQKSGLILVDTKYEFGLYQGNIYLMDEIHTPDSSRYFYADGYAERLEKGEEQQQLSKEFVREWLMANGFQGKEGQEIPTMSDEWVNEISNRYIHLYEKLSQKPFQKTTDNSRKAIENAVNAALKEG
jgi:phosphoribosylaminoimidazole-succinocarboxamide synthase